MEPISLAAHAKINLMLSVGDALPEGHDRAAGGKAGYHLISSWFARVDLCDDVRIEPRANGSCADDPSKWARVAWEDGRAVEWPLEKDLAVRAARAIEQEHGTPLAISLHLTKRIPAGAGLGGGSSDAGAVLRGLGRAIGLSHERLMEIAMTLGSDVGFFVSDYASAIVEGLGESVEECDVPGRGEVILCLTGIACDTRAIYGLFDTVRSELRAQQAGAHASTTRVMIEPRSETLRKRVQTMLNNDRLDERGLFNELEAAVLKHAPQVGVIKTNLQRLTRRTAHVTGSGGALFIVPEAGEGERTLERAQRVLDQHGDRVRKNVPQARLVNLL